MQTMARRITVVAYDPAWEARYCEEAALVAEILGPELEAIYHIGSTSVQGLWAKPVIDLMPMVRDVARVDAFNGRFEAIGYECMGEFGIGGRRFFRKGGDARSHHVHVFESGNRHDIERHLAVRDYLRTHPEVAEAYGRLKCGLAERFPEDIDGYCDGKDAFVKQMERDALLWRREGRTGA